MLYALHSDCNAQNMLSLGCIYPLPLTDPSILARVGTEELGVLEGPLFGSHNKHIIEEF